MIIVGIDPGGRDTAIVKIDSARPRLESLLTATTINRPVIRAESILEFSRDYLFSILETVQSALYTIPPAAVLAIEGIVRPHWHAGGKAKPVDPTGIMATSITYGSILGRDWPNVSVLVVRPGGNGALPVAQYPTNLRPERGKGAGFDGLRHARAAFDVACRAVPVAREIVARDQRRRTAVS